MDQKVKQSALASGEVAMQSYTVMKENRTKQSTIPARQQQPLVLSCCRVTRYGYFRFNPYIYNAVS
jgi:hypothetical protein